MLKACHVMLVALLLGGCATPVDDLLNNRFADVAAEPVPAGMDGNWTGTSGPYLMTLRLLADGRGTLCNSYGASNYLQAIKHSGGSIYIQDGTRMSASSVGDELTALPPYSASQPIRFRRDTDLEGAAPYCRQNL